MTFNIIFKSLLALLILTFSNPNVCTKITKELGYPGCLFSTFDIVSDATIGIQNALNEKHKPYLIRREYRISGDTVSVITKSHFSQYRKKPKYKKEVFKANTFPLLDNQKAKIKFVYKSSDKNHITQINKRVKNSNFKIKKIAFNSNPVQAIIRT